MATDSYGRRIDYLRISITDRCNLRCRYCMPADGLVFKSHEEILTYEEMTRFVRIVAGEGISKIRITGGEPLVRAGVVDLIGDIVGTPGIESVALTTNGTLLSRFAEPLYAAGLRRVNVSLDTLDADVFERITRGGRLADAMEGIEAVLATGFEPVKLNAVVVRSLNQDLLAFARLTMDRPLHVRFIEYMPVGAAEEGSGCHSDGIEGWSAEDSVPSDEVLRLLSEQGREAGLGELVPVAREHAPGGWGPARYHRFEGAKGTIGVISPLSHHFCAECNRLRLTADGRLRPCLFSDHELDVRTVLRQGDDEAVRAVVRDALCAKPESHEQRVGTQRSMSQIGG